MEKYFQAYRNRPHDTYFEQVFKVLPVALQLIRHSLPPAQLALMDLKTLQLSTESFVDDTLREAFSDLIYVCQTTQGASIRICLLFEHKSYPTGKSIYPQLLQYIRGIQVEDIVQHREYFSLSIPILFYHGSEIWRAGKLAEQYGAVPEVLSQYIPAFEFVFINLQSMSDDVLLAMEDALLLRSVFLAFKNARNDDFFRHNYQKIFIFASENVSEESLMSLFNSTFLYIQIVSSINKEEIMAMVQTLSPEYGQRAKTIYEQFVEEGIGRGIEQGIEQGIERSIRKVLTNRPDLSDNEVAFLLDVSPSLVQKIRADLQVQS